MRDIDNNVQIIVLVQVGGGVSFDKKDGRSVKKSMSLRGMFKVEFKGVWNKLEVRCRKNVKDVGLRKSIIDSII